MDKILSLIVNILQKLKAMADALLKVVIPVGVAMVASDVLFGTTFGVFERLIVLLQKVGISGNFLTIALVIVIVLWWNDRKKV